MKAIGTAGTIRHRSDHRQPHVHVNVDGLLLAYMFIVFAVTAAVAIGFGAYMRRTNPAGPTTTIFSIGETRLGVPNAWLRDAGRAGGTAGRVELAIPWPSAKHEPGLNAHQKIEYPALDNAVLVSIGMADAAVAPADRPSLIYARFMTPDAWPNPGGLVMRRFKAHSPYAGEELYLAAPDGRAFWARCPKHDNASAAQEGCISEVRIGNLDVRMEFSPARLTDWKRLSSGVRRAVAEMIQ